jgi:hypothetical protein
LLSPEGIAVVAFPLTVVLFVNNRARIEQGKTLQVVELETLSKVNPMKV